MTCRLENLSSDNYVQKKKKTEGQALSEQCSFNSLPRGKAQDSNTFINNDQQNDLEILFAMVTASHRSD